MRLASALALLALAGAGTAALLTTPAQAERRRMPPPGTGTANPGLLVATEIAFARTAREEGHDKAALKFAAEDEAVMFAPGPVPARSYLAGNKEAKLPVAWQTHQVWMSCDGTVGVTKGAWQQGTGATGYYATIWKRQKKGVYRWVLDQSEPLGEPLVAPEMLPAAIADCGPAGRAAPGAEAIGAPIVVERTRENIAQGSGRSDDGTLTWSYVTGPGNARKTVVSLRKGGEMQQVLSIDVPGTEG